MLLCHCFCSFAIHWRIAVSTSPLFLSIALRAATNPRLGDAVGDACLMIAIASCKVVQCRREINHAAQTAADLDTPRAQCTRMGLELSIILRIWIKLLHRKVEEDLSRRNQLICLGLSCIKRFERWSNISSVSKEITVKLQGRSWRERMFPIQMFSPTWTGFMVLITNSVRMHMRLFCRKLSLPVWWYIEVFQHNY